MSNPFAAMPPAPPPDAGVLVRLPTASLAPQYTSTELWAEPLDTPGIVPRHLVRSATASFPFLEVLQRLLHRLRFDSTTVEIEKVLALVGLYRVIKPAYNYVKDFFFWACTVQVTIPETDPVAREVLSWMATEVIRKGNTRSAMLITGGTGNFMPGIPPPIRFGGGPPVQQRGDEEVACLPPVGTRLFWIGFRPFLFSRNGSHGSTGMMMPGFMMNDRGQMHNALTIYTLGWTLAPLRKFTDLCHELKMKNLTGTTNVYFAGGPSDYHCDGWQCVPKAIRKLDTIDMDEDVKADIVKDAEYYNSDDSRQFFADCGIPYRRGYLFWGPPGTGKSSLSIALAGHLQCDIYHINLASGSMSDGSLHRLFLALPKQCIIVLEDIDSAGIDREQGVSIEPLPAPANPYMPAIPPPPPPVPEPKRHRRVRNTVTLSGLLNAIDGNASQEGRLLIMTSNNPDSLDAALTRPGRVDKRVYFGHMSKAAGKSIFLRMIGRWALSHDSGYTQEQIEKYADEFAEKIPEGMFTPAEVQNFLQDCRRDPERAVGEVDAWVREAREKGEKSEAVEGEKDTLSETSSSRSSDTSLVFSSSAGTDASEVAGDDEALRAQVEKETQTLSAGEESDGAKK